MRKLYDLEDRIMDCWDIIDHIRFVSDEIIDNDPRIPADVTDMLFNVLMGLELLYGRKFEVLFKEYEAVLREHHYEKQKIHTGKVVNPVKRAEFEYVDLDEIDDIANRCLDDDYYNDEDYIHFDDGLDDDDDEEVDIEIDDEDYLDQDFPWSVLKKKS